MLISKFAWILVERSIFIGLNNFENNGLILKEFPERTIGRFKKHNRFKPN